MLSLFQILNLLLDIVWFFVIAHIIMSWLINFQVLNIHQPIVGQLWRGLNQLLAPLYTEFAGYCRKWAALIWRHWWCWS